ncbi:hypothetical protein NSQ20_11830 [Paenibacillus sp. FSL K6-1122]|uniref:hypothetical protein n=1 Tax=Paenibacillus sp. FSL K6-1122 TaxID=2954512 RepID=UPI0030EC9379
MAVYRVRYTRVSEYIMEVEAKSEDEALDKYRNFDCLGNYEDQGISEEVISVRKKI